MARSKPTGSGEGKTPLVIALVFFVLATLAVGGIAYSFQGEIDAAKKETADAKEESKTSRSELSKAQDNLRLHQVVLGMGTEEDRPKLSASANKDFLRDEHTKIMGRINGRLQTAIDAEKGGFVGIQGDKFNPTAAQLFAWPWPNSGEMLAAPTPGPLVEAIVKYYAEREMAMRKLIAEKKTVTALEIDLKAAKDSYIEDKKGVAVAIARITTDIKAFQEKIDKEKVAAIKEFQTAGKDLRVDSAKLQGFLDLETKKAEEAKDALKNISEQLERELAKQADKDDPFAFDNPKGVVTATFRGQNIVEINLGSADNVRAGLFFNIQPQEVKEQGLASRIKVFNENGKDVERMVPKAKLEVIEVLGPNLSRARVTEVFDPIKESILKGDLLYNAAWRKGSVDHVVLYGIFDIDGDGSDDIKTVERALTKMGIVVDGYFDLSSQRWVGGGPNNRTAYAVEGAVPSGGAGDRLLTEKGALVTAINLAREEAKKKGAKAIRYRDFFPRIGYTVKYDVSDEQINQAAAKYLRTNVAPDVPK